jgi:cysteinyl-tRNA synthetase
MSMKHLGESFDIHTGGIDNMFPHHEDEIAQSEAATGATFVRYWLHCAHLVVDGKKMSKSLGNFYTLRDLTEKGYSGREIRYELIATHYRQSLNFTFESLQGARTALGRLDEFRARLAERATEGRDGLRPSSGPPPGFGQTRRRDEGGGPSLPAWAAGGIAAFREALDDDLNISGGLAAVFDMLRAGNKALDEGALGPADAAAALRAWDDLDRVLGFLQPPAEKVPDEVLALAAERQAAREKKDWPEADRLRKRLAELGWTVKDTAEGPRVKRSNQ